MPSPLIYVDHKSIMATCGFYLALWARLIEIGVRTTFCIFARMSACIYEELGEQMEEMVENEEKNVEWLFKQLNDHQIIENFERNEELLMENREKLEKWKYDYENVFRLVENVNSAFGLVLLLFISHDLAISIYKFEELLQCPDKVERACAFAHQFFRFLALLSASYRTQEKVNRPILKRLSLLK